MYPCETFARSILPVFRGLVAKELIEKYAFTQLGAAEKLGTTQASISYYIHSKRGRKDKMVFKEMLPTIQAAAREAAKDIAAGKISPDEVVQNFCKVCMLLREERKKLETASTKDSLSYPFIASGI